MSRSIEILFEVRDQLIMKETLKQLGFNYEELNSGIIEVHNPEIEINIETGVMVTDSNHEATADGIKCEYMVNFYRDKAIREGNKFNHKIEANGEIVITISH